ncbi:MAG: hypothetical protein KDI39_09550 [Pseudomonadales bacterium]|nr:hypothetical protein [Pseudomonadales bacterium]
MDITLSLSEQHLQTLIFSLEYQLYQPSYLVNDVERAQVEEVLQILLKHFPSAERRLV